MIFPLRTSAGDAKVSVGLRLLSLLILLLSGCGFNKSGVVYPELLKPTGWKNSDKIFKTESFNDYALSVRQEVSTSRIPFVVANTLDEVTLSSPAEFRPGSNCTETRGIAILVHGLSDSAFSMRDVARTLADDCYIARTALLPGHGTKPGDLLNARVSDWIDTVQLLLRQAASEHDHVIAVGFSMGALLTMTEAIKPNSPIDAVISISPAFYLTTSPYAELTRWLLPFKRWLDTEKPDDTYRYEAIPTIAVVETVKAKKRFHEILNLAGSVNLPWLVIQSASDLVIQTTRNQQLFLEHAKHEISRLITFRGDLTANSDAVSANDKRLVDLHGRSDDERISGLTHVAVHQAPDNLHYGIGGDYRNCGVGGARARADVRMCEQADTLWLGPWNGSAPDGGPYGLSSYNPNFAALAQHMSEFLEKVVTEQQDDQPQSDSTIFANYH